ncbi:MAG: sigma factor G inhibitor Gin [Peptococcia bacterium]
MLGNISNHDKGVEYKEKQRERKIVPVCSLCNKVPEQGIRSGFFLRKIFICQECEESLLQVDSHEKEDYFLAMAKLKRVLFPH